MVSFIWSVGSVLGILLIISFLPLGFTFKGKLFIASASFVLTLAGLAAVSVLSIWQIAVVLLLLSFLTAYMMDRRMGSMIYTGAAHKEEELEDGIFDENSIVESNISIIKEENIIDDSKIESIENFESQNEIDSLNKVSLAPIMASIEPELIVDNDMLNDVDVSFFLDREMEQESVLENKTDLEEDYLFDIESLLVDELEEKHEENEDLDTLDDSTLELLFSAKEVAPGLDETEKSEKKLVLQK